MSMRASIERYYKIVNEHETTIYLQGKRQNYGYNTWEAFVTIINCNETPTNQILDTLNESDEGNAHYYLNKKLYKIVVNFSPEITMLERVQMWNDDVNYSTLGIPVTIWCNLIGQIVSKL